ncbi:hypothetical protein EHI8A_138270 [Entamoeba histolytica HM-1:IMSS-B]|uniref:RING-type domain-containing protein n=5 Tax=Entamoeba histolytica TaxID=5759 RepID=C4M8Q1_ENTH1|nr:hypothetical protein EHI_132380 [Entamoeba histolytica HM-1:IMSS]EMD47801.1 Hypothetical protein EHI5A_072720 [Entamoeba histolytica KU27]EMH74985.1 hypothetical protein EHI8A_138270 [Entamoeba histolytica HM-1:IMSS-B]ENY59831.1 hypothetical protein EHI7A_040120 [Entamoeba histolytica HM-1:IMSS-A]GAT97991.1 hypothetical protein CL6EHI_132380 [Entamoeba histolytica]EAL44106.1 hypothetical protein EHI_132380 [Entamoeba histolytica HM-1:IMSS]|eukprot:XP_649492.1 hypothetical protein EHI_132380 [Entamoeba histolytica HM-1:IMSS]
MSSENTYYCENCHKKYNRNKGILVCPFCGSDFVVEQPFVMFKKMPIPENEMIRRSYNQSFNDYSQPDLIDFPHPSSERIPFHPDPMSYSGDLYMLQPRIRNPIQIYPRNPYTGSSHEPYLGIYDRGNFGTINDISYNRPTQPLRPMPSSSLQIIPKECCVFCEKELEKEEDIITLTCGHQCHSHCVKSSHCPICTSLYN